MSKKIMTIPEFLEMTRVKEFNRARKNKQRKQILFLIALIAILIAFDYSMIDLSSDTINAFQNQSISL
jgi:hypothetical protein